MIQNAPIDAAQDEVILSAKYSIGRVSLSLIICCLFVYLWSTNTYDIAYAIYDGIVVGGQGPLHFLLLGSIIPTRYIAKFLFRSSELLYNTKSSLKETNKYDINSYRVD